MKRNSLQPWHLLPAGQSIRLAKFYTLLAAASSFALLTACDSGADEAISPSAELGQTTSSQQARGMTGINVLLKGPVTDAALNELKKYGTVVKVIPEINALSMRVAGDQLSTIQGLSFVDIANPDAERKGAPADAVSVADFSNGISTWNLDAVNVTDMGEGFMMQQDATGVYVGVLDTGLLDSWRQYFPEQRIATQYAKAFGGGGGEVGNVSEQPNKWEHDQNSHGTHVTSTIIGFNLRGTAISGVAPKATIIPVKVLNQNGSGWSSVVAQGIVHIANLKAGPLKDSPVVINMSLGGPVLDAVEKAAVDYAIEKGVIIVASAGNSGMAGMGYPGAYAPVISVASAGLVAAGTIPAWWYALDIAEPTNPSDFYLASYSSRAKPGQDLDVTAPGSSIVGPYQLNSGQLSYYYLSGTSMASPHVAGIVALMVEKNPALNASQVENVLETVAIPMPGLTASEVGHGFITADAALGVVQ
ncbi:S8 family peptidase [Pontibacter anaerobius]|uniref:S8 family serine peptidase n=1 Tax=Pontibacter anaerobius TaxID=2993940 RepID=A0ABT3RK05_9BACT|nr:S8 family serine peptidase [Pontibacter anaerobius]MCX2742151.1 S8 family serine peptidase [Pontibacter anaerobius]